MTVHGHVVCINMFDDVMYLKVFDVVELWMGTGIINCFPAHPMSLTWSHIAASELKGRYSLPNQELINHRRSIQVHLANNHSIYFVITISQVVFAVVNTLHSL